MKKILLGATALSFLFATSCKKKDDGGSASNSFTVDGKTYSPAVVTYTVSGAAAIAAADISGASVGVYFGTTTPANGTYDVVTGAFISTQVSLLVSKTIGSAYISHAGGQKLTATLSGGKMNVTGTDIWVYNQAGTDSLKVSMNMTQTN